MEETCDTCTTTAGILKCQGCQAIFSRDDFNAHRNELDHQFEAFSAELNKFPQISSEASIGLKSRLISHIDTWETKSIQKIQETAVEARRQVETLIVLSDGENTACIRQLTQQLQQKRQRDEFDERDLTKWKQRLDELKQTVSKPWVSVDEQQTEIPFIMNIHVNQGDIFDRTCGDVCIKEEGKLACHKFNLFGNSGQICGKREYSTGIHRILFKIKQLDNFPWWFFGIISKSTPMQGNSQNSSSAYGWAGRNEIYMNGKCLRNVNGYISDFAKGDRIELILDCDHRLIRMINLRSTKSHEINIDLMHCPFPWMVHLNLFHIQTCIRINP